MYERINRNIAVYTYVDTYQYTLEHNRSIHISICEIYIHIYNHSHHIRTAVSESPKSTTAFLPSLVLALKLLSLLSPTYMAFVRLESKTGTDPNT